MYLASVIKIRSKEQNLVIYQDTHTPHCLSALSGINWLNLTSGFSVLSYWYLQGYPTVSQQDTTWKLSKSFSPYSWLFQNTCPNMLSNILGLSFLSAQDFKASSLHSGQLLHLHYQLVLSSSLRPFTVPFPEDFHCASEALINIFSLTVLVCLETWLSITKDPNPTSCKWAPAYSQRHKPPPRPSLPEHHRVQRPWRFPLNSAPTFLDSATTTFYSGFCLLDKPSFKWFLSQKVMTECRGSMNFDGEKSYIFIFIKL